MVQSLLPVLQTLIALANICVIAYGFYKFLGRPHSTLEQRVAVLEAKIKENEDRLKAGNKRFETLEEKNTVFMHCMLCFIDFEIAYCQETGYEHSEDLMKAKAILHEYLATK